jgi:hypothetical protein
VKVLVSACLFLSVIALPANADIIYFKDGMKSICQDKAWEEKEEVKCEYGGWVITYQKKDVLRIVKTTPEKSTNQKKSNRQAIQPKKDSTGKKTISPPGSTGPVFYNPRRPYKYWTDKNSKYKSYKEAIQALARQYNRSPEWIQAKMGDTNDLKQIHQNLANPDVNRDTPVAKPPSSKPSGIAFYNPRRNFPYWSDKNTKHKSYKEAIKALAHEYKHSPEWIQTNMGTSNDLNEIHQNLKAHAKID